MQGNKLNIFLWLLIFIGLQSANQWSEFPIGNTYTEWIASTIILLFGYRLITKQNIQKDKKNYIPVALFLCWAVIGAIRGAYVAENYWEYKNLVYGVFASSLPFFVGGAADESFVNALKEIKNEAFLGLNVDAEIETEEGLKDIEKLQSLQQLLTR